MKNTTRKTWLSLVASLLFVLSLAHLAFWQQASLKIIPVMLGWFVSLFAVSEQLKVAHTASLTGQHRVAHFLYTNAVERGPENRDALFAAATSAYQLKRHLESEDFFKALFTLSEAATGDVGWLPVASGIRGQNLLYLGQTESARRWLTVAMEEDPLQERWTFLLIEALVKLGRRYEALGLTLQLEAIDQSLHTFWSLRSANLVKTLEQNTEAQDIWAYSVTPKGFSLPVLVGEDRGWRSVKIDSSVKSFRLPAVLNSKNKSRLDLQIGPWKFESVAIETCDQCEAAIGASILGEFRLENLKSQGLNVLVLESHSKAE